MIALDDDSPLGSVTRDNVDDFLRIGAISHEIAEERIAARSALGRVFQARLQSLEVAVDIGQEGDDQRSLRVFRTRWLSTLSHRLDGSKVLGRYGVLVAHERVLHFQASTRLR